MEADLGDLKIFTWGFYFCCSALLSSPGRNRPPYTTSLNHVTHWYRGDANRTFSGNLNCFRDILSERFLENLWNDWRWCWTHTQTHSVSGLLPVPFILLTSLPVSPVTCVFTSEHGRTQENLVLEYFCFVWLQTSTLCLVLLIDNPVTPDSSKVVLFFYHFMIFLYHMFLLATMTEFWTFQTVFLLVLSQTLAQRIWYK